jgi:hypothetical protein
MALESAANIKTAVGTAATALTTVLQDTVLTELAQAISHPSHPLRDVAKLFNFNPATGAVTADDDYIDAALAGAVTKANPFRGFAPLALTLTTATVEDAAPADIVLTFNRNIDTYINLAVTDDADPALAVDSIVIAANVVTITMDGDYVNGDAITLSGNFTGLGDLSSVLLTDQVVTNNVAA